jgi:signal transduction histidine kinase
MTMLSQHARGSNDLLDVDVPLEDLVRGAHAAIAVLRGPELIYAHANRAYCRLVGHESLAGVANRDVYPCVVTAAAERVFATGTPFVDHELTLVVDREGNGRPSRGYFDISIEPLVSAYGVTGVAIFAVEITSHVDGRMFAESKRAEAERRVSAKDDFLALVSHELRNPLMAILGWIRLLRAESLTTAQSGRALERIELAAVAQSKLIDDLLDVPRILAGKLHLERQAVDLAALVEGVLESSRPAMAAKALRLQIAAGDGDVVVHGDEVRLQQVVWNLVTNAIKFTRHGGLVSVAITRADGWVELAVADDGEGLSPGLLDAVFERFKQGDSPMARKGRGLGLGLWIARDIVKLHGGSIRATSPGLDRGATFIVRLPLRHCEVTHSTLERTDHASCTHP